MNAAIFVSRETLSDSELSPEPHRRLTRDAIGQTLEITVLRDWTTRLEKEINCPLHTGGSTWLT